MFLDTLDEGRVLDGVLVLACDVVYILLVLLHAGHVVLQAGPAGMCRSDGQLEIGLLDMY